MRRDSGSRKYRLTVDGEQPVWATAPHLARMGRSDARLDYSYGSSRGIHGNLVYARAYQQEWERLQQDAANR